METYDVSGRPQPFVYWFGDRKGSQMPKYTHFLIDQTLFRHVSRGVVATLDELAREYNDIPFCNKTALVAKLYCSRAEEIAYGKAGLDKAA